MNLQILTIFLVLLASLKVHAVPNKIILIRHGEKEFRKEESELNSQGCQRAFLLPNFFKSWDNIEAIYAQQPKKDWKAIRTLQTVAPTADFLNLSINNHYLRNEIQELVQDIFSRPDLNGKTVLIAWEHSMIPKMAQEFGLPITQNLNDWRGEVFDQAWILTFKGSTPGIPELEIVAEHLLPTDITNEQSGIQNWGKPEPSQTDGRIKIPESILKDCKSGNASLNELVEKYVLVPVFNGTKFKGFDQ
jgi:hypothetical protein